MDIVIFVLVSLLIVWFVNKLDTKHFVNNRKKITEDDINDFNKFEETFRKKSAVLIVLVLLVVGILMLFSNLFNSCNSHSY